MALVDVRKRVSSDWSRVISKLLGILTAFCTLFGAVEPIFIFFHPFLPDSQGSAVQEPEHGHAQQHHPAHQDEGRCRKVQHVL